MQKENTEIEVARMTAENIQFLDIFFAVCKRYKIDYYHATSTQRGFVDAAHEYAMKQARQQGLTREAVPPFLGVKRSERSNNRPA